MSAAAATTARLRRAVEGGDLDGVMETFAPDVVLHSPITGRFRFEGHAELRELMRIVLDAIDEISYSDDVGDDRTRALFYTGRVEGTPVQEAALVRLDDEARIRELTIFFRPLPGLAAVMAALGPGLARARGRRTGLLIGSFTRPLVAITRLGDATAVPLVRRRS